VFDVYVPHEYAQTFDYLLRNYGKEFASAHPISFTMKVEDKDVRFRFSSPEYGSIWCYVKGIIIGMMCS